MRVSAVSVTTVRDSDVRVITVRATIVTVTLATTLTGTNTAVTFTTLTVFCKFYFTLHLHKVKAKIQNNLQTKCFQIKGKTGKGKE
jgi:hypothetical protein